MAHRQVWRDFSVTHTYKRRWWVHVRADSAPALGGHVLDVERTTTTTRYWDGDLMHFTGRTAARPGQLAAMVVAGDGHARGWINLTLCRQRDRPLIWLRLQAAARRRACTLLWASDLAVLAADDREEAQGA